MKGAIALASAVLLSIAIGVSALTLTGSSPGATSTTSASNGLFTTPFRLSSDKVAAGGALVATITIANRTGRPLVFASCRDDASLIVGLGNQAIPWDPNSGAIGCHTVIHPGRNFFNDQVVARDTGCLVTGQPRCLPASPRVPPLPPGTYDAVISWTGVPAVIPRPQPISVRVEPLAR